jgi:hypothetical protein
LQKNQIHATKQVTKRLLRELFEIRFAEGFDADKAMKIAVNDLKYASSWITGASKHLHRYWAQKEKPLSAGTE